MDKYEYNLKLKQMAALCENMKYTQAAEIADSINWNRIKNVNTLVQTADVYEKAEKYDEARALLVLAYNRSPFGKTILVKLIEVALKLDNLALAKEYYEEYMSTAPHDSTKYIFKYQIMKKEGSDLTTLIGVLLELKAQAYLEQWAYELACLYAEAGQKENCIEECEELILWYGEGLYVERARALMRRCSPDERERYAQMIEDFQEDMMQMEKAADPLLLDGIVKKTSARADEIKELQSIKYDYQKEEIAAEQIALSESRDDQLKDEFKDLLHKADQQEEGEKPGNSIKDALNKWEKMKTAAETALKEANKRKLKAEKERALRYVKQLILTLEKLRDRKPDEEDSEEVSVPAIPEFEITEPIQEPLIRKRRIETIKFEPERKRVMKPENRISHRPFQVKEVAETAGIQLEGKEHAVKELAEKDLIIQAQAGKEQEVSEQMAKGKTASEQTLQGQTVQGQTVQGQMVKEQVVVKAEPVYKEPKITDDPEDFIDHSATKRIPDIKTIAREWRLLDEKNRMENGGLSDELKSVFSYFVPVRGMEAQLCSVLDALSGNLKEDRSVSPGNLIIQGGHGSGKTALAVCMIKALQKNTGLLKGPVGKIYGEALNRKDIGLLLEKVEDGCLLIESAGNMDKQTANTLSLLLEQRNGRVFVILEDTSKGIKKALGLNEAFAKKFTHKISVPIFSNDDLVAFAKAYSRELGYEIDEMGVLAVYNSISSIQKADQSTTITEVKTIIDKAIERENQGKLRKAMHILFSKRYSPERRIFLRENDFDHK